jgi:hypothetical protein
MTTRAKSNLPKDLIAKLKVDELKDNSDPKDLAKWRQATADEEVRIESLVAKLREKRPVGRPPSDTPYKGVHLNLPLELLARIKLLAEKRNIGYQSLIKTAIAEFVEEEEQRKA